MPNDLSDVIASFDVDLCWFGRRAVEQNGLDDVAAFATNGYASIDRRAIGQGGQTENAAGSSTLKLKIKRTKLLTTSIVNRDGGHRLEPSHMGREKDAQAESHDDGQNQQQRLRSDDRHDG